MFAFRSKFKRLCILQFVGGNYTGGICHIIASGHFRLDVEIAVEIDIAEMSKSILPKSPSKFQRRIDINILT